MRSDIQHINYILYEPGSALKLEYLCLGIWNLGLMSYFSRRLGMAGTGGELYMGHIWEL